ncbi:MAG: hypothetical protein JOZ37_12965, partial [Actinobacteria bacterium]|nr:hypothetical protein [Actinomycetota bacterium]
MRSREFRGLVLVIALATAAGACAKSGSTGVAVKGVDANLVFGTKQP